MFVTQCKDLHGGWVDILCSQQFVYAQRMKLVCEREAGKDNVRVVKR